MKCYVSATDNIGAMRIELFQAREFRGPMAGLWQVIPMFFARRFYWQPVWAVMDDFGNLVAVEG